MNNEGKFPQQETATQGIGAEMQAEDGAYNALMTDLEASKAVLDTRDEQVIKGLEVGGSHIVRTEDPAINLRIVRDSSGYYMEPYEDRSFPWFEEKAA